jgi:hypothetical protein
MKQEWLEVVRVVLSYQLDQHSDGVRDGRYRAPDALRGAVEWLQHKANKCSDGLARSEFPRKPVRWWHCRRPTTRAVGATGAGGGHGDDACDKLGDDGMHVGCMLRAKTSDEARDKTLAREPLGTWGGAVSERAEDERRRAYVGDVWHRRLVQYPYEEVEEGFSVEVDEQALEHARLCLHELPHLLA